MPDPRPDDPRPDDPRPVDPRPVDAISVTSVPERPAVLRGLLVLGVVAVSFAAILIRVADASAVALAFWRSLAGALVLAPFAVRSADVLDARQRRELVLSGVCLAVHFALFIGAFALTSVASAVVFVATSPVFVGLGAWVFLGQSPARRTWAGIGLSVAGAVVIGVGDAGSGGTGSDPLLGDLMALGGAVAVSGYLLIGQRARQRLGVATYGTWVYGTAAVVLAGTSLVVASPLIGFDAVTWWAIVGLVVGPQLLGHTIFNQVLNVVPATTVAVVVLAEPVAASLLALVLLGEVPPPLLAVGAPLILAGVYLASTSRRDRSRVHHVPDAVLAEERLELGDQR